MGLEICFDHFEKQSVIPVQGSVPRQDSPVGPTGLKDHVWLSFPTKELTLLIGQVPAPHLVSMVNAVALSFVSHLRVILVETRNSQFLLI